MAKPEMEFHDTELMPWVELTKDPDQYVKILCTCPKTGAFTRLNRSQADLYETISRYEDPPGKLLIHDDSWEEVYSFSGTLIDTTLNQTFKEGYFACRPPGMRHGPFFHPTSAVSYEVKTPAELMDKPEMDFFDTTLLPFGLDWDTPGMQMASVDHAMWFHRPFRADDWLLYAQSAVSTSSARGMAQGSIFTSDGRLAVSVVQEGLTRLTS